MFNRSRYDTRRSWVHHGGSPHALGIVSVALVPAALPDCGIDSLSECVRADHADQRLTSAEIPDQGPKEG
jgi:hypothetical protein